MKHGKITIDGSRVNIEPKRNGEIRLTRGQLADLFEVYYGTITANIKTIIKSGVVKMSFEGTLVQVGKTVLPEYYEMEMIVTLAFRLDSPAAERIRQYVVQRMAASGLVKPVPQIFLSYGAKVVVN
jgi:hypothetical protein